VWPSSSWRVAVQDAETGILEHLNESSCFEKVKHIWADCGRSRGFNNKRIERSVGGCCEKSSRRAAGAPFRAMNARPSVATDFCAW
jgi:hypothetical protein